MNRKNLIGGFILVLSCLLMFSIPTAKSSAQDAEPLPTQSPDQQTTAQIEQVVLEAVAASDRYQQGKVVSQLQVSEIRTSKDMQWATAWVVYYDYDVEAMIPTEPALAVTKFLNNDWQVYLPFDTGWEEAINAIPNDLLTAEEKEMWVAMNQGSPETAPTQSGYFLPWQGGKTASLSRSVGHDADYSTAHFAFDFYVGGTTSCPAGNSLNSGTEGLNFNIYASKAATVWGWDDSVENCNHSAVNFIVLRNVDDPTIFQLYMHLSQGSIPPALKVKGAPVARGQFIAVADNTGASSGSHLHFQVERQPTWPSANPYWNTALDMTFDDVTINGGRPRVSPLDPPYCKSTDICDNFTQYYVSGNYYMGDSVPPTGKLSGVANGVTVSSQTITLSGWGTDSQSGLDYGQLKANFNNAWHDLGPKFNPSITYTWDMCNPSLQVDNGVVGVAMVLVDKAGNSAPLVGLSNFIKNYSCSTPPPACIPDQNQIAIFEDPYFEGGCVKFNIGNYPTANSLNPLGNDDGDSILVGDNVIATLYSDENYSGHSQSLVADTSFLNYQWVEENTLSSMKVASRLDIPQTPIPNLMSASVYREGDVISFAWKNAGGTTEFQVQIYKNNSLLKTLPWQSETVTFEQSLGQGDYKWRVQGRNGAGVSTWSSYTTFSIVSPIVPSDIKTVPYSDTMETTQALWPRDGLWTYTGTESKAHSGTHSWWYQNSYGNYDTSNPNSGSLTSPPFSITAAGFYLRFYYRYQTETIGNTWDQRWVQISVDGAPFTNLVQLSDDPQMAETSSWLKNKAINLSSYVGHTVQIRFQFTTWDASANNYSGWGIDDFSITATAPESCEDNRQDDSPTQASLLVYDPTITVPGQICPNGDMDFYKFYGEAGDRLVVDINAMSNSSLLDAYLYLLDPDGKTVIAENDDEIYAQIRDPLLGFTLDKDGLYFLKLRAWKNPLVGGANYFYTIRLYEDHTQPQATITWPGSSTFLPNAVMTISANVMDVINGVNRVEFYWHSPDWSPGEWELIDTDRDGSDGWKATFDPAGQPEGNNAAFYVKAYDMAGNYSVAGAWNLVIDRTAPVTAMKPLEGTQPSNAFQLTWTASDNLSGIDRFEIQEAVNSGNWTTLPPVDEVEPNLWIIGTPGRSYSYRMRGIDHSGNSEAFPSAAETSTTIPSAAVLCAYTDIYDSSGNNDNSPTDASLIMANGESQQHNFCNPTSADYQGDQDWVKLAVLEGEHYSIYSHAESSQAATIISLFAEDGTTILTERTPGKFGDSTMLFWTPDHDQTVYIRLMHLDSRVIGSNVVSTLSVNTGTLNFIPLIHK